MSENKLRPCPFCGKEPEVAESGECRCNNKSCPMAPNWYLPEDWNPRPIEDALNARIAEQEAFIDQLIEAGNAVVNAYPTWVREEDKWDDLVKDWKEREE